MALEIGISKLNSFQKNILDDCIKKGTGGLSIPLGSGKTLISLVLGLYLTQTSNPILVIVSKTLLESWVFEINKFFGDKLKYAVLHNAYCNVSKFVLTDDIKLIITTPEVTSKFYKDENISEKFIKKEIINEAQFNQHVINTYNRVPDPLSTEGSLLFSTKWGCLIVDEIQKYTKISTIRCQSIASICSNYKWVLSGTMFSEPSTERILGYHLIIDHPNFPRSLPWAEKYIKSRLFRGFNSTIVKRDTNPAFKEPKINQIIVSHELSYEEAKIYMSMKKTMGMINEKVKLYKELNDTANLRKFSSYLLALICYLRQCIICPILPIANVAIDMTDFQNKSKLSSILSSEIDKLGLKSWLSNVESVKSSRFKKALEVIDTHPHENLIVFTCFRTCLDVFKEYLPTNRKIYTLSSTMSSKKRAQILEAYNTPTETGMGHILLLTYEIGCEGLNLQVSNTVLLLDFYWNDAQTQQAIGRVLRYGQMAETVNIYMFTANTAIESAMFEKHDLKLMIINELSTGTAKTKLKTMKVEDIINLIQKEENIKALNKLHNKTV